jgi:hypothetical protein
MNIHTIRDLSDRNITQLLETGLKDITDEKLKRNYSPEFKEINSNLFYILENGRFSTGNYFIIEDDGKYICSAGWNHYTDDTALVLTRAYIIPEYRTQYLMGIHLLPRMIEETINYTNVWITCNGYNKSIYNWFERTKNGKRASLFNNWPKIYEKFEPLGIKNVNYTDQYVVGLKR